MENKYMVAIGDLLLRRCRRFCLLSAFSVTAVAYLPTHKV